MNNITLEGTTLKIVKEGKPLPYRFPLASTFIAPNPSNSGFMFKYENEYVECIAVETTMNGSNVTLEQMDAQLTTWNQNAVINVDVAEINGEINATNLALEHVSQGESTVTTSATGTNFVVLPSFASKKAIIYNDSVATLEFKRGVSATTVKVFPNTYLELDGHTNTNNWSVKRLDNSNTQVTVSFTYLT
jgi:hypothetical protein